MEEKDIILSKWIQGEISDEEVKSIFNDVDLDYLKSVLLQQEKLEITASDSSEQWDIFETQITPKPERPPSRSSLKWIFLAGIILIGLVLFYIFPMDNKTIVEPNSNEFLMYALDDGSTVRLWPNATLKFDEANYLNKRFLELDGQAFFDVEKGNSFIVKTKAGQVQVLGTSFDVWSPDKESTIVKCHSGKVSVKDNNENEVILATGEKVVIEGNKIGLLTKFDTKLDQLDNSKKYYENAKVDWVISDLQNLFEATIIFDESIKNQRFTGLITTKDINRALSYLCETMNWSYVREGEVIKISSQG